MHKCDLLHGCVAEWNGGGWQSVAFRSGSILDQLCDLGLVPALSGPRVLSCKVSGEGES